MYDEQVLNTSVEFLDFTKIRNPVLFIKHFGIDNTILSVIMCLGLEL